MRRKDQRIQRSKRQVGNARSAGTKSTARSHGGASRPIPLPGRVRVSAQLEIIPAISAGRVSQARTLFHEYAAELGVSLCFQNFNAELATLPGDYALPTGALFVAEFEHELAGCVALRKLGRGVCEMKRLYVRPAFRGKEIGRALAKSIVTEARRLGYRAMALDTLSSMRPAMALYQSLGFKKTKAYYANPLDGVVYMKLRFSSSW